MSVRREREVLLSEAGLSPDEKVFLANLSLVTLKPALGVGDPSDMAGITRKIVEKSGVILFFTAGKKEVRAWPLKAGGTALDAAARFLAVLRAAPGEGGRSFPAFCG